MKTCLIAWALLSIAFSGLMQNLAKAAEASAPERKAVRASILAYMVASRPSDTNLVYFVEMAPDSLELLKQLCGKAFQIHGTNRLGKTPDGLVSGGTHTRGVLLYVRPIEIHGYRAEARAVYDYGTSRGMSDSRYKLERKAGKWRVVSVEIVCAS